MSAKLDLAAFGRRLVESGDLDPVYFLVPALPAERRARWLVAYWCFYHVGTASWLCERDDFWDRLVIAGQNIDEEPSPIGRWPRSSERRHFRGATAWEATNRLRRQYKEPEQMIDVLKRPDPNGRLPFATVHDRVRAHYGFGPWIAFKAADMLERCLKVPVTFDEADVFMYSEPVAGAKLFYDTSNGDYHHVNDGDRPWVQFALNHLRRELADLKAPPDYRRPLGLQEFETVLCKWKSYMNGHYHVHKDLGEVTAALQAWAPHCLTAATLLEVPLQREETWNDEG